MTTSRFTLQVISKKSMLLCRSNALFLAASVTLSLAQRILLRGAHVKRVCMSVSPTVKEAKSSEKQRNSFSITLKVWKYLLGTFLALSHKKSKLLSEALAPKFNFTLSC